MYIVVRRCQFSDRDGFLSRWEPSIAPASIARARGRNEFRSPPLPLSLSVSLSLSLRQPLYPPPDLTELATNVSLSRRRHPG